MATGFEREKDRRLKPVRVLILIDQDVIEPTPDVVGKDWIAHGLRPVQQQIVIIEHILALLGFDIGRKQILQFRSPSGAPRERRSQHLFDRSLCVDAPRVDRNAGSLGREAALGFRQTLFVTDQIHQVGRILAIVDRESGVKADPV